MRTYALVLALLATSVAPAFAQPGQRCTHETFPVGGQSLSVTACAGAPDGGKSVPVTETIKNASAAINHSASIELLPGAAVSRGVDDVSLSGLGLNYTLHLTLAYRDGSVSIEHALLLPGAVPLK